MESSKPTYGLDLSSVSLTLRIEPGVELPLLGFIGFGLLETLSKTLNAWHTSAMLSACESWMYLNSNAPVSTRSRMRRVAEKLRSRVRRLARRGALNQPPRLKSFIVWRE